MAAKRGPKIKSSIERPAKANRSKRSRGRHWSATKDERLKYIIDLMLGGEWQLGKSTLDVMQRFGITAFTAEDDASDASRFIRMSRGDLVDIHNRILLSIDRAERAAFNADKIVFSEKSQSFIRTPDPDLRALHSFLQLQCEVHGLCRDVKPSGQMPAEVGVPVKELAELLGGLGFEVTPKAVTNERKERDDEDDDSEPAD